MSNLTSVGVTNGAPSSGTGTVSTLDAVLAIEGTLADTKETNPDSSSATQNALLRGILQKTIDGIQTPGQSTSAQSISVVQASDAVGNIPIANIVSGTASNTDGTSTQVLAAGGTGVKQYLTKVSLSNTNASTSVMVALKSGTTSMWRANVPPGGREITFNPPLPPNSTNEAWSFDPDSAVTTIECSMIAYKV